MKQEEKKVFVAPVVERIQFEESDVIETSGEDFASYTDRYGYHHEYDAARQIWHIWR